MLLTIHDFFKPEDRLPNPQGSLSRIMLPKSIVLKNAEVAKAGRALEYKNKYLFGSTVDIA